MALELELVGRAPADLQIESLNALAAALNQSDLVLPDGHVSLKLVSSAQIQKLNRTYAGINEPTDVLSFGYPEYQAPSPELPKDLGDIAICLPIARRQAKAAETDFTTETATLALHGLLHLAGFDHQTPADQAKLDRLQADILKRAGLSYRDFAWKS